MFRAYFRSVDTLVWDGLIRGYFRLARSDLISLTSVFVNFNISLSEKIETLLSECIFFAKTGLKVNYSSAQFDNQKCAKLTGMSRS